MANRLDPYSPDGGEVPRAGGRGSNVPGYDLPGAGGAPTPSRPQVPGTEGPPPMGYWEDYFKQQFGNLSDPPAFAATNQDQARILQQQVMQQLQAQAAGTYDTRAQQELAQQNRLAQQGQYAIASSQRGALGRQAAQGAGQVQAALPGQSELLKLQEQQAAQAMLAQMYAQQHAQDLAQAEAMAQSNLQGQALNDAMQQFYAGQGGDMAMADLANRNNYARAMLGLDLEAQDFRNEMNKSWAKSGAEGLGTAFGTGMQMWNKNNSGSGDLKDLPEGDW